MLHARGEEMVVAVLPVLVPTVVASLGRGRIVGAVTTTEVAGGLGFLTEVGLDVLFTGGVLGGDVQELSHHA